MTDRIKGCWVTFNHDMREDDAQPTLNAILALKNVLGVTPFTTQPDDYFNRERIKREYQQKIWEVFEKSIPEYK